MAGLAIPQAFTSIQGGESRSVAIRIRHDLDRSTAAEVVEAIQAVTWGDLVHAYGSAADVEGQLIAAVVGDEKTRQPAWWNLWGNIHHQGTIYEATVPATPIIGRLAGWSSYPDRVEAISFLRAVADAEGVVVWAYSADGQIVFAEKRQRALTDKLSEEAATVATSLLRAWRDEPPPVRRALLWLLSAMPALHDSCADLVAAELPDALSHAWSVIVRGPNSQEEFDEICAFEEWALAGTG